MSDIELVIKIPEEKLNIIKNKMYCGIYDPDLYKVIANGTPLEKIRAEIEQLTSRYTISRERGGMGQVEWSDMLIKESEVLEIIDKYKAESEEV